MKPVLTDRIAVILIVAGLVLWACCFPILWGWAFNPSGAFSLRVVLLILATTWVCLWRREKLARITSNTLRSFGASDFIPFDAGVAGQLGTSKQDAQQRMRLLAAAGVLATACFIFSTLIIIAFAFLITRVLSELLLLSSFEWSCIENISLLIGIFPLGLGFAAIVFASNVVRSGSGRDTYAACYRDWLWGIATGFAAFGIAWWFGANLIFMVFAIAAVIIIVSFTAVSRMELATHPRRRMLPFGAPEKFTRLKIVITHAAIVLVLILQVRMFGDIFALSMTRRMVWVFLSISMLVYFLGRIDRKSRPPSKTQAAGAVLGIAAAATAQGTEFILCLSLESSTWIVVLLGIATQIPMTALTAMLVSQQRRLFSIPGGTAGRYFTSVSGGIALAVLGYIFFCNLDAGLVIVMWIAAGAIILAGLTVAKHKKEMFPKLGMVVCSLLLGAAMVVGAWRTYRGVVHSLGEIQPGVWLSSRVKILTAKRQFDMHGVLPLNMVERSQDITDCLAGIFERRKGRWWIVASDQSDLPNPETSDLTVYSRISRIGANPQPPSVPKKYKRWPPLSHSYPNSFRSARLDLGHVFYDGVFLAPLPADHPQAWRCYNKITMFHCYRHAKNKNADGHLAQGIVVLRTQTSENHVRDALGTAKTFYEIIQSGWAIVAIRKNGLDMLLVGPDEALTARQSGGTRKDVVAFLRERTRNCDNVFLVPLKELWKAYDVEEITLRNPPGEMLSGYPKIKGFQNYLEKTRDVMRYNRIRDY